MLSVDVTQKDNASFHFNMTVINSISVLGWNCDKLSCRKEKGTLESK